MQNVGYSGGGRHRKGHAAPDRRPSQIPFPPVILAGSRSLAAGGMVMSRSCLGMLLGQLVLFASFGSAGGAEVTSLFNPRTFGATGDGKTVDTAAFNKAIDAARAAGGGTVFVSAGTYVCG